MGFGRRLSGQKRDAPLRSPSFRSRNGYPTATLAVAKGRLIRCTVPRSTPNCLAMTRTPGRQERQGLPQLAAPPALFPSAPLSPTGLELRANSIGAFSGFHEATPLTSSAERATGVT